jgi:hypothetical protein
LHIILNGKDLDFKTYELEHIPFFQQFEYYGRLLSAHSIQDDQELLDEASRLLELAAQDYKMLEGLSNPTRTPITETRPWTIYRSTEVHRTTDTMRQPPQHPSAGAIYNTPNRT